MAKSSTNEPNQVPPIQKVSDLEGKEMIVDSPRPGTPGYNESVFNLKNFL